MKRKIDGSKLKKIFLPSLLLSVTFGICGPIQLYLTNMSELWFSIGDIGWMCLLCGVLLFIVALGIGILLPKRATNYYGAVLFGISLGLYLQGNFVPTDYGVLDGREINWDDYQVTAIVNTGLWVICIVGPIIFQKLKPLVARILPMASGLIIAMQVVTIGILLATNNFGVNDTAGYLSDEGINTVSSKENVIVFVLDTFDQEYFRNIYANDPDFLSPLDGFTYFDNATGMYPTTKGALPYILTGQIYENEQPYSSYIEEAYHKTDYYETLISAGYDIGIYTAATYMPSYANDYFINYVNEDLRVSSYQGLAKTLYNFVCFRYFPHILKECFWFYSGEFDEWRKTAGTTSARVFDLDNFNYYSAITGDGLQVVDDASCYRFIHLQGVHSPYTMNENIEEVTDGSITAIDTARGCLKIVYAYLDQLKELGVYDNSTVVVMADHGSGATQPTNPLFMIKPQESAGSLQINSAPVCQGDLMGTIMEDIGLNDQEKYGRSAFDIQEGELRERKFLFYTWDDSWDSEYLPKMVEYQIDPENNDLSSYHITDYQISPYNLGDIIRFDKGGTSKQYCIEGFSIQEEYFTWAASNNATMELQLSEKPEKSLLVDIDLKSVITEDQYMIVKVKDEILFESNVQANQSISFAIPQELVTGTDLKINFEFPNAISPAELNQSSDVRKLSVAFSSMMIQETDLTTAEVSGPSQTIPAYELGTELEFTKDQDDTIYFTSGISDAEADATWSEGTEGQMKLALENVSGDLQMQIEVKRVITDAQTMEISSAGEILYSETVPAGESTVSFTIPQHCVENGILTIDFYYPDAVAPASINSDSTDTRILSVAFSKIVIEAIEK